MCCGINYGSCIKCKTTYIKDIRIPDVGSWLLVLNHVDSCDPPLRNIFLLSSGSMRPKIVADRHYSSAVYPSLAIVIYIYKFLGSLYRSNACQLGEVLESEDFKLSIYRKIIRRDKGECWSGLI